MSDIYGEILKVEICSHANNEKNIASEDNRWEGLCLGRELSLLLHLKESWSWSTRESEMTRYKFVRDQIALVPSRPGLFNLIYCDFLFIVNILKAIECGVKSLVIRSDKFVV